MKLMLSLPDKLVDKIRDDAKKSYRPLSKHVQMILEKSLQEEPQINDRGGGNAD